MTVLIEQGNCVLSPPHLKKKVPRNLCFIQRKYAENECVGYVLQSHLSLIIILRLRITIYRVFLITNRGITNALQFVPILSVLHNNYNSENKK